MSHLPVACLPRPWYLLSRATASSRQRRLTLWGLALGLAGCIEVGPHGPLGPLLPSSPGENSACRPGTPLPSGPLFTDITEQAGLRGITGIRVASADAAAN